tara:strand:- start:261 stop:1106 length:846 start_codon:yes stop_codon:yes gene_type:complete
MRYVLAGLMACVFALGSSPACAQTAIEMTRYGPTVTVQIGEAVPRNVQMLFDTGAAISVYDAEQAEGLELTLLQEVNVGSNTGSRTRAGIYRAGPLVVGTTRIADIQMLVLDLAAQGGPFVDGISGVLSPTVLGADLIEIDFAAGIVSLREDGDRPAGSSFPYSDAGLPTAQIWIAGREYTAQIDTGASVFMTLPTTLATALPLQSEPETSGQVNTVNDSVAVSAARLDGDVEIAGVVFESPSLEFVDGAESILLGMAALEQFVITLAPASGEAWLTRAAD